MTSQGYVRFEGSGLKQRAEQREEQRAWCGLVLLVCMLLMGVAGIGGCVWCAASAVVRKWEQLELQEAAEIRGASAAAELRGAGVACRAWARAEDYPESVDEMCEVGQ